MHSCGRDVEKRYYPMNAKVEQRVIIEFLSNEQKMRPKFITDFSEPFNKMLTLFPLFINGFELSRLGGQVFWTGIGRQDRGSITSIPKFCQCSKKMNLIVFDRLPRSWTFL
jgi:hypothetical protein